MKLPRDAVHHGGQHETAMAMIRAYSDGMHDALERMMAGPKGAMAIYDQPASPLTAFYTGIVFALANAREFEGP